MQNIITCVEGIIEFRSAVELLGSDGHLFKGDYKSDTIGSKYAQSMEDEYGHMSTILRSGIVAILGIDTLNMSFDDLKKLENKIGELQYASFDGHEEDLETIIYQKVNDLNEKFGNL